MTNLMTFGIALDSSPLVKYRSALDDIAASARRTDTTMTSLRDSFRQMDTGASSALNAQNVGVAEGEQAKIVGWLDQQKTVSEDINVVGAQRLTNLRDQDQATAQVTASAGRHKTAVNELARDVGRTFDQVTGALIKNFVLGEGKAIDFSKVLKTLTASLITDLAKDAITHPLRDALFGSSTGSGRGALQGSSSGGAFTPLTGDTGGKAYLNDPAQLSDQTLRSLNIFGQTADDSAAKLKAAGGQIEDYQAAAQRAEEDALAEKLRSMDAVKEATGTTQDLTDAQSQAVYGALNLAQAGGQASQSLIQTAGLMNAAGQMAAVNAASGASGAGSVAGLVNSAATGNSSGMLGSLGNLSSVSDLFKGSSSLFSAGKWLATSQLGQFFNMSTLSGAGVAQTAGVMALPGGASAAATPVMTGLGTAFANGLSASPWGIVGSMAGGLMGFGKDADPYAKMGLQTVGAIGGGMAGAAIGAGMTGTLLGLTVGEIAGPIGAAVGALIGTMASSLFPADKQYPASWYVQNYGNAPNPNDPKGVSWSSKVDSLDGGDASKTQDLANSARASLISIAGAMGIKESQLTNGGFVFNPDGHDGTFKKGYSAWAGGGWEDATVYADQKSAVEGFIVQSLKKSDRSGVTSKAVNTVLDNATDTTSLESLQKNLTFAETFDEKIKAMTGAIGLEDAARKSGIDSATALTKSITDFKQATSDAGLDTTAAATATRAYVDSLVSGADPKTYTQVEAAVATLRAQWDNMIPVLEEVGYSAEDAGKSVAQGFTNSLAKLQSDYATSMDAQINKASGRDYINSINDISKQHDTGVRDATALGVSSQRADDLQAAQLKQVMSGLTPAQLQDIINTFGGLTVGAFGQANPGRGISQMATAALNAPVATATMTAADSAQTTGDLYLRGLKASGKTAEADQYTRDKEYNDLKAKGATSQQLADLQWSQGLEKARADADAANSVTSTNEDLTVRAKRAQGLGPEADGLDLAAKQRRELFDAEKAGYDAATIAGMKWAQSLETAAATAEAASKSTSINESLQTRADRAKGLGAKADGEELQAKQRQELFDAQKNGYDAAQMAGLKYVQGLETEAAVKADAAKSQQISEDLYSRSLRLTGKGAEADAAELAYKQSREVDQAVASGYTDAQMAGLKYVQSLETVAATQAAATKSRQIDEDLYARSLRDSGHAAAADAAELTYKQQREMDQAVASGYTATQIAGLSYVQGLEKTAAAIHAAAQAEEARNTVLGRAATVLGKNRDAGMIQFDINAKKELASAVDSGMSASDMASLKQTLAAERAQTDFNLAKQDYLDKIDQQIAALQADTSALQGNNANLLALKLSLGQAAAAALTNPQLSPLAPLEQLKEARSQFEAAVKTYNDTTLPTDTRDRAGNELQSLGQTLITASKAYYAGSNADDFNNVLKVWQGIGNMSQSDADKQQLQIDKANQQIQELQKSRDAANAMGARQLGSLDDLKTAMNAAKDVLTDQKSLLSALKPDDQSSTINKLVDALAGSGNTAKTNLNDLFSAAVGTANDASGISSLVTYAKALGNTDMLTQVYKKADSLYDVGKADPSAVHDHYNSDYRYNYAFKSKYDNLISGHESELQSAAMTWLKAQGYTGGWNSDANIFIQVNGLGDKYDAMVQQWGKDSKISGFAEGTPSAPAGWAWIGEQGPELMRMAGGETILPRGASLRFSDLYHKAANDRFPADPPAWQGGAFSNAELLAEVRALREEVARLRADAARDAAAGREVTMRGAGLVGGEVRVGNARAERVASDMARAAAAPKAA